MACVALVVEVDAKSEISKRIKYWKTKIQDNIHVIKDVINIDENNLWCVNSIPVAKVLDLETCPTSEEKLSICLKDEEKEQIVQKLNDIKDDDLQFSTTDKISESTYLQHEQNYKILLKEYTEVKELCKEAETSQLKKLCGDLDANMRKLLKLHENMQNLKRQMK